MESIKVVELHVDVKTRLFSSYKNISFQLRFNSGQLKTGLTLFLFKVTGTQATVRKRGPGRRNRNKTAIDRQGQKNGAGNESEEEVKRNYIPNCY